MQRLVYLANIRLPTERAHGLQIMKMCEAFAREGYAVTLIVPTRHNKIQEDPYSFYSVAKTFDIVYVKSPDLIRFGPIGFVLMSWIAGFLSVRQAFGIGFDWIYSRDGRTLWFLSKKTKFIWEAHDDGDHWWKRKVLKNCSGLVTLNKATQELHERFASPDTRVHIAPSPVSLEDFAIDKGKEEIRGEFNLSLDKKIILYAGHLYPRKGVDTLAEAAKQLPEYDFVFIGGTASDLVRFRGQYGDVGNIKILGHKLHKEVALYLKAADLLVLPNSAKDTLSLLYTSPIKLFEYMASGVPILSSDVPSAREVLDESVSYFFEPDSVSDLVRAITGVFATTSEAETKAHKALIEVKRYSYAMRAKGILDFMNQSNVTS